jgi:uncharacterized protein YjbI with pentapeptide repeats
MKHCALLSCGRPALADPQAQGYCILHAPWDGKDLSAFQAAIDEIIEKARQGSGVCDFSHCYFPPNYDCQNLKRAFKFSCNFTGAQFAGEANFWGAKFLNDVNFWRASFSVATFREAEFSGNAYFMETNSGAANFMEARFIGNAYFERAKLDADFEKAEFRRDAVFLEAQFFREANFSETKFYGVTLFARAKFSGSTSFSGAKFSGNTNFEETEFSQETSFDRATFSQSTDFSNAKTKPPGQVWFWNVFSKPQQIKFHHVDLSRWSFLDTDLRRIDFDNVAWGTIPSISPLRSRRWIRRWERRHLSRRFLLRLLRLRLRLTPTRTALFDEIRVSNKKVKVPKEYLAKVERLYRHLKQNYESQRDYGRAGDFYYGEMEMKRRQLNPLGQIPFWIYRILSGYGESYPRALFWLIVMWLLFAVLFTVVGYTDEWGNHADLWRSLIYSAQSMTLFHEPKITFDNTLGQAVELVASVLGVIQIALFGLALQRRFKR